VKITGEALIIRNEHHDTKESRFEMTKEFIGQTGEVAARSEEAAKL
tara:strand:- start:305 stop:442 length:138 start_codon:yes stop_codon:yes gene_type:complete